MNRKPTAAEIKEGRYLARTLKMPFAEVMGPRFDLTGLDADGNPIRRTRRDTRDTFARSMDFIHSFDR